MTDFDEYPDFEPCEQCKECLYLVDDECTEGAEHGGNKCPSFEPEYY